VLTFLIVMEKVVASSASAFVVNAIANVAPASVARAAAFNRWSRMFSIPLQLG
jgi:hypothetical protein